MNALIGRVARPEEARSLLGMSITVLLLHAVGWGGLAVLILPAYGAAGGNTGFLLGLAVSAYALGIRHAFDADHIAAIDNATRSLLSRRRQAVSVGFWFALGHSSVVLVSVALLVLGLDAFSAQLADDGSALRRAASVWGAAFSGFFLLLVAALNLPALRGMRQALRSSGSGALDQRAVEAALNRRGVLSRVLHPFAGMIDRPSRMYPVGFLFGLGLDTAASVALFVAAAGLAPALPWYGVLLLPVLFTAGMTLFDSADGLFMNHLYQKAAADPYRRLHYNLAVTGISVGVAFFIGGTGLLAAAADVFGAVGPLAALAAFDVNLLGVGIALVLGVVALATARRRSAAGPRTLAVSPPTLRERST